MSLMTANLARKSPLRMRIRGTKNKRMVSKKEILIIAGPNGAGKTTFATEFLPK